MQLPVNAYVDVYKVVKVLNSGGFAHAYKVVDTTDNQLYFMKELYPQDVVERAADGHSIVVKQQKLWQNCVSNFEKEATTLNDLSAANVPGLVEALEFNNTFYLIQEFVDGIPLDDWIEENELTDEQALYFLVSLLYTLSAIHNSGDGVLHRDIKPANIILSKEGLLYLVDFGAVRTSIGGKTFSFSERSATMGFAPFEQINTSDNQIDQTQSADLYSLAATFYRLMFGFDPLPADKRARHIFISPGAPKYKEDYSFQELAGQYQQVMLDTLDKAFEAAPYDRIQTAEEWLALLPEPTEIPPLFNDPVPQKNVYDSSLSIAFEVGREEAPFPDKHRVIIDDRTVSTLHLVVELLIEKSQLVQIGLTDNQSTNHSFFTDSRESDGRWQMFEHKVLDNQNGNLIENAKHCQLRLANSVTTAFELIERFAIETENTNLQQLLLPKKNATQLIDQSDIMDLDVDKVNKQKAATQVVDPKAAGFDLRKANVKPRPNVRHGSDAGLPPEPEVPVASHPNNIPLQMTTMELLFSLSGTIRRSQWWGGAGYMMLIGLLIGLPLIFSIMWLTGTRSLQLNGPPDDLLVVLLVILAFVYFLLNMWMSIALFVKRMRDHGFGNGTIFLLAVAPIVPYAIAVIASRNNEVAEVVIGMTILSTVINLFNFVMLGIVKGRT